MTGVLEKLLGAKAPVPRTDTGAAPNPARTPTLSRKQKRKK